MARSYYRSAAGAMIVFDVTKRSTFIKVQDWLNEARANGHQNINFLLVGNKCDMSADREITVTEAKDLAFSEGFNYIETSARTSTNVEQAFLELSMRVLEKIKKGALVVDSDGSNGVKAGVINQKAVKTAVNLSYSQIEKDSSTGCCGSG